MGLPAELVGPQQQPQFAAHGIRERRRGAGEDRETEVGAVEVNGLLNVVDHVAHVHQLVVHVIEARTDDVRGQGVLGRSAPATSPASHERRKRSRGQHRNR
jgi:hypothetical protein